MRRVVDVKSDRADDAGRTSACPAAIRGVATLGTLYLALEPHGVAHAFAAAIGVQLGIVVLLILGPCGLPTFTLAGKHRAVIADA